MEIALRPGPVVVFASSSFASQLLLDLANATAAQLVDNGHFVIGDECHWILELGLAGGVKGLPAGSRREVSECQFGVVHWRASLGEMRAGSRRGCGGQGEESDELHGEDV